MIEKKMKIKILIWFSLYTLLGKIEIRQIKITERFFWFAESGRAAIAYVKGNRLRIFKHSWIHFVTWTLYIFKMPGVAVNAFFFPFVNTPKCEIETCGCFLTTIVRADPKSLLRAFAAYNICDSCHPEAPSDPFGRQKSQEYFVKYKIISRNAHEGSTPSRSTSHYHNVSIILIEFIFADNNCKYNLTNYHTHNILYMKSWLNRLCIINWHIYLWELGDNTYSCHLQ